MNLGLAFQLEVDALPAGFVSGGGWGLLSWQWCRMFPNFPPIIPVHLSCAAAPMAISLCGSAVAAQSGHICCLIHMPGWLPHCFLPAGRAHPTHISGSHPARITAGLAGSVRSPPRFYGPRWGVAHGSAVCFSLPET